MLSQSSNDEKCSLGISNFLEEISSLSHSVVFLSFFPLITEEGFLISPCYLSFSPLPLASLLFSAICKASSNNHFAFLFLGDDLGMDLTEAEDTRRGGKNTQKNYKKRSS